MWADENDDIARCVRRIESQEQRIAELEAKIQELDKKLAWVATETVQTDK